MVFGACFVYHMVGEKLVVVQGVIEVSEELAAEMLRALFSSAEDYVLIFDNEKEESVTFEGKTENLVKIIDNKSRKESEADFEKSLQLLKAFMNLEDWRKILWK